MFKRVQCVTICRMGEDCQDRPRVPDSSPTSVALKCSRPVCTLTEQYIKCSMVGWSIASIYNLGVHIYLGTYSSSVSIVPDNMSHMHASKLSIQAYKH